MAGSVVNNNTLFAPIQAIVSNIIETNPSLLVTANNAGGVMANLIFPQSIAITTAAVGETGNESVLTKITLNIALDYSPLYLFGHFYYLYFLVMPLS